MSSVVRIHDSSWLLPTLWSFLINLILAHSAKAFTSWANTSSCLKHELAQSDEEFTRGCVFNHLVARVPEYACGYPDVSPQTANGKVGEIRTRI
jgi:hypothetical protein